MYKLVRGFASVVKKTKMELTVRTPYKVLFKNFTDFKRVRFNFIRLFFSVENVVEYLLLLISLQRSDELSFLPEVVLFFIWLE